MKRGFIGLFSLSSVFLFAFPAYAVPYFAVIADTTCDHCHVNPTGGGMRNDHGVSLYGEFPLRGGQIPKITDEEFKGRVNRFLAVGGDLRVQNLSTVQSPRSNSFTIPWGTLYLDVDPVKHFTLYADTDLVNVVNREAFGLLHDFPGEFWVKFGRLNLPYGLRLPDDTSFIRAGLGFTFTAQDIGLEVGAEPGRFTFVAGLTNGVGGGAADDNNAKAVSWFSEWRVTRSFRLGGSFFYNDAATTRVVTGGGHTGLHIGPMAFLGEVDVQGIRDKTTATNRTIWVGYGEADYRLIQGLVLKTLYDGMDDKLAGSGLHHRISGGIEIYPIQNLETDLLYRARIGTGALGADQLLVLLHGYF